MNHAETKSYSFLLQINQAYVVLSDKVKRLDYDRTLERRSPSADRASPQEPRQRPSSPGAPTRWPGRASPRRAPNQRADDEDYAAYREQMRQWRSTGMGGQRYQPPNEERWQFTWCVAILSVFTGFQVKTLLSTQ